MSSFDPQIQKFLHKTTEISYQKLLAMICAAFKISKEQNFKHF